MRFLSFNIHGWQTPDGRPNQDFVAEVIADSRADVVSLNEVWHRSLNGTESPLAVLAQQLGMHYAFGLVGQAMFGSLGGVPYGNAVLSRSPILAHALHQLPPGTHDVPRGLFEVHLALPSARRFTLYITHLDHRSESARLRQWEAAQSWLARERGRPHILAGDFNALSLPDYATDGALAELQAQHVARGWVAPDFQLMARVLAAGYVDTFLSRGQGPGATWPATDPERRVDYILLSPELATSLVECRCWDAAPVTLASDHRPVLAVLNDAGWSSAR